MAKFKGIFRPLDELLFKQIDVLKKSPSYQKMSEQIASLGETQQKVVNQITTFSTIVIPFIIALVIFFLNSSLRSDIELKKDILTQIQSFQSHKIETESIGRRVLAPRTLSDKNALKKRIDRIVSRKSIGKDKITISDFNSNLASGGIEQVNAKLNFKKLTSTQFTDFLLALLQSEKMKVEEIEVNKDKKSKRLMGHLLVIHYGKTK